MEPISLDEEFETVGKEIIERIKEYEFSSDWQQNGTEPCIKYKMFIGHRVAAKGTHICEFPFEQVVSFLRQEDSLKKMNNQLIDIKVLQEKEDVYKIHYMQYRGIWPVANRDFVNVAVPYRENNNKVYIGTKACHYPYPQQKGVVRGQVFLGAYIIQRIDQGTTKVTYISDADLKGSIPTFLKNALSQLQGGLAYRIAQIMKQQQEEQEQE